jgi:glucuronoarabinoxylan endo-1,4-beta-xylanase
MKQKGATIFETYWNAPNVLLAPNTFPSRVAPNKYEDNVAYLNAFNTFMTDNGAPMYAISVKNEPHYGDFI